MGVYTRPGQIDIAMDLPHPVLWMEASASMPVVLKDRVVEAFQRLHERGVVHGDVALRHILIGPDARVTLIDFQASRADEPNEDLGLAATYPGDRDLEMRRVKFLLNMDNARRREFRKSRAAHKRSVRNRARAQRRHELLRHGITTGLPLDEPELLEDIKEPPVPLDELEKYWMEDANDDPRRFVVPGSSDSEVTEAISSFLESIRDLEKADCGWSIIVNVSSSPRSPLNSPTLSPHHASIPELPRSIKVRDFAYESTCWSSTPHRQVGRDTAIHHAPPQHTPPAPEASVSCERGSTLTHVPGQMKRHREESEEKPAFVERLPASKRIRLNSSLENDPAIRGEARKRLQSNPASPRACESRYQGSGSANVPEPVLVRSRESEDVVDIGGVTDAKKIRGKLAIYFGPSWSIKCCTVPYRLSRT
jgi:Lipopolysaccharide kinase (Kdo/WaaP) family